MRWDRRDGLTTRAKYYCAHRIHLDEAPAHSIGIVTAAGMRTMPTSSAAVIVINDLEMDCCIRTPPWARHLPTNA
jgi:hypothetical protein